MNSATKLLLITLGYLYQLEASLAAEIIITNHCSQTLWPATLTSGGKAQLPVTGFKLGSGQSKTIAVPTPWTGRVWARTNCANRGGKLTCLTGDCASGKAECNGAGGNAPASLVEINIAANGGQDFYDISLVDGFNVPVTVKTKGGHGDCEEVKCPGNVNKVCPKELAVKDGNKVVGCKSACTVFNKPEYCCGGLQPDQCPPTNYSKIFKKKCPMAYSYAYDDHTSTFTCFGNPSYHITFC